MKFYWRLWLPSFALAFLLIGLFGFWHGGFSDSFFLNRAVADASFVMIGLSFALSGICYFFNERSWLVHRKYLGVVGFFVLVTHGALSLIIFPFTRFFASSLRITAFLSAVLATLFFTWLAIISSKYWMKRLHKNWRLWLRAGYIAFVFGWLHFTLLYWNSWQYWFASFDGFPEPSLVLAVFGLLVLVLRGVLWLKIKK